MNSDGTMFDFSVPVEQQELNISVYNLKENIMKLCNLTEKLDLTTKQQSEPCNIVDLAWLFEEKCNMINNIKKDLKESETNLPMTEGEMLIKLYDTLVKENKQNAQILEDMSKTLHSSEEKLSELKECLRKIELNRDALETSSMNTPHMLDVKLLFQNSGKKMRTRRENLHMVLDAGFKNSTTKDLIQDLSHAYFKGGENKYINLSEATKYSIRDINMLKESGLVVEHPYDGMRIKMSDII